MITRSDSDIALSPEIPIMALQWRNDPAIWKWCRQNSLLTKNDQYEWEHKIENDPKIKMFGIMKKEYCPDGLPTGFITYDVGVCGFTSIDRTNQSAEFSLYIAPQFQRKGFAKDALFILLQHGFQDLNLNRVWGESFDGNPAQTLFKKLGMHLEGTLKEAYFRSGQFIHSHIWAITRKEFCELHSNRLSDGVQRPVRNAESGSNSGKSAYPWATTKDAIPYIGSAYSWDHPKGEGPDIFGHEIASEIGLGSSDGRERKNEN